MPLSAHGLMKGESGPPLMVRLDQAALEVGVSHLDDNAELLVASASGNRVHGGKPTRDGRTALTVEHHILADTPRTTPC